MKRLWQIAIILSLLFALGLNFLTGAQLLGLPAINDISDTYATLLTPASYAFSIWSLIYLLLIVLVVYQARDIFRPKTENDLPQKMGPLFVIASICNGLWTYIFVQEYIGLSVVVLLILTAALYALLFRLQIALYDAPRMVIATTWWPLLIYTGWVTVASVVNIASWVKSLGGEVTPIIAAVVLAVLAVVLLWLLRTRNARELVLASTWGIFAIGVQQIAGSDTVAITAFTVSVVLLVGVGIHAYQNRQASPFI